MILAAGLGSRMRPLTDALPKPLLPFLNTPIIAYAVDHLVRAGARRIGVNVHHLPEAFAPVLTALETSWRRQGVQLEIVVAPEPVLLGTGGGVANIWRALGRPDGTAIVVNGDPVYNADLAASLAAHQASGAPISMLLRPLLDGHPGRVWLDGDRVVGLRDARLSGAPVGHELAFMGIHLLEPELLHRLDREASRNALSDILERITIPTLLEGGGVRGEVIDDFWVALDTPALLLGATRQALDVERPFAQSPAVPTHGAALSLFNPRHIHGKALLSGPVFLGAGAAVGAGARVGPNVVADHTEIGPGTVVKNAVLFGMGRIEGTWTDCVAINGRIAQLPGS